MATRDSVSSSAGVVNESVVFIVVIKLLDEHSSIVGKEVETQAESEAVPGPAFRIRFRSIDSLASPEKNLDRRKRIVRLRREPLMSGHAQDD